MRCLFPWDVAQRRLIFTDVSEQPIGPIFKGLSALYNMPEERGSQTSGPSENQGVLHDEVI